jgi:hypothetical protein
MGAARKILGLGIVSAALLAGCGKNEDPVAKAAKQEPPSILPPGEGTWNPLALVAAN